MSTIAASNPIMPATPVAPRGLGSARCFDVPSVPIYRLTVSQYHGMIQAGILCEDEPVELLEGWLVPKMPKNPPHVFATQQLRDLLPPLLPLGWFVSDQEPITTDDSEPEPDVQVVRGQRRDYAQRHPGPGDTALVVEVAESSLGSDRKLKMRVFARAQAPVYWIVNLIDRCIEAYTDPSGPCDQPIYRQRQVYGPDDDVPVMVDGRAIGRIAVRDLLL